MKNGIYIDIDTERPEVVLIGKPPEITPPTTAEEAQVMITNDIMCVTEALCTLIHMSDQSGYGKKQELVMACIGHLNDMLIEKPKSDAKPE